MNRNIIKMVHPSYNWQQKVIGSAAKKAGCVAFYPNYHGQDQDCNTVIFYTSEDAKHNELLDAQERSGMIVSGSSWRSPVAFFENTDNNGHFSYHFGNRGAVTLCGLNPECVLEEYILRICREGRAKYGR